MTSDYQFHRPLEGLASRWERVEAATHRQASFRRAGLVVAANLAGFGLLWWIAA